MGDISCKLFAQNSPLPQPPKTEVADFSKLSELCLNFCTHVLCETNVIRELQAT